eukprot:1419224-Amphidinium_carterae.1
MGSSKKTFRMSHLCQASQTEPPEKRVTLTREKPFSNNAAWDCKRCPQCSLWQSADNEKGQ